MSSIILFCSIVIFLCIIINKFTNKLGIPALLFFMFLGMLFGSDGILKINFEDYDLTSKLCSIGLLFIIFYGGFCTKKINDKRAAAQAILLSSVGTIITALLTAVFCYYVLKLSFAESFLVGSVISSTDAASVFAILRSKRLNLKYNTAPIIEFESGSNDPFAYMLTIIGISLLHNGKIESVFPMLFSQIGIGLFIGIIIAYFAIYILKKTSILIEGTDTLFIVAVALASFSFADVSGGNGFLSVYVTGLILGNSGIKNKISMIHFFDGITSLSQIVIFFLIGFLAYPHKIPESIFPALLIMLFLSFIARPIAVSFIMLPFKAKISQISFISWAGLRGAASIVFAIFVVADSTILKYDLFHIVFIVVLISVAIQGSMLPYIARKEDMIDRFCDVRKTFNDYQQEAAINLNTVKITKDHPWIGAQLKDIHFSENSLLLLIIRNNEKIIPNGDTTLQLGDEILSGTTVTNTKSNIELCETIIDEQHQWLNKKIKELRCGESFLIAIIKRGDTSFVPNGNTRIELNDTVVFYAS